MILTMAVGQVVAAVVAPQPLHVLAGVSIDLAVILSSGILLSVCEWWRSRAAQRALRPKLAVAGEDLLRAMRTKLWLSAKDVSTEHCVRDLAASVR